MIKAKLGDAVQSKSDRGQVNEVLCKVLYHNLCVLIQAIHELGIEPRFHKHHEKRLLRLEGDNKRPKDIFSRPITGTNTTPMVHVSVGVLEVLVLVREDAPAEPWAGRSSGHARTAGRVQALQSTGHIQDAQRWRHRGKGGAQAIGEVGRMAQTLFHLVLGLHHHAPIAVKAIPHAGQFSGQVLAGVAILCSKDRRLVP